MSRPSSIELLPAPFAWVDIPAGKVTLVENFEDVSYFGKKYEKKNFDVTAFKIAKYPVTNGQFAIFVAAGGYTERRWWTDAGWQLRESEGWQEPRYWQDEEWNRQWAKPNYPVICISWYEAVAYCLWLSETTSKTITLPTEQQWQRAAQGDTKWVYPWGDQFNKTLCNFDTQGTTPVTQYEGKGNSPFDVVDMVGNVWEWCLTDYETGEVNVDMTANRRVVRGGSWTYNNESVLRVDFRYWDIPHLWINNVGFRLSRS